MRKLLFAAAIAMLAMVDTSAQRFGKGTSLGGGDHLFYVGTYAGNVQIIDEATEQKIGEIKLQTGIPRSLILSQNRQHFYVLDSTLEKIEVVDIASRSTLSQFTLSEGNKKTRVRSMQVDPL